MHEASDIEASLLCLSTPKRVADAKRFFRTGEGMYGADDRFLGISVPHLRAMARTYDTVPLPVCFRLLASPFHEARLLALFLCIRKYRRADAREKARIVAGYLKGKRHVNNWDLVDASAAHLLGDALVQDSCAPLYALVRSSRMWDRRIALVATHAWVRAGDVSRTLTLCALLVGDQEDLMHKALGWTLREVGKRNRPALDAFLRAFAGRLPRTALRYAIERHSPKERDYWMHLPRAVLSTTRGRKRKV